MKSNGKHKVNAQIAGPGLVLVALLVLVFSSPAIGRAQAGPASPAIPAAIPAKAAPIGRNAQLAAPGQRQPGGNHESIKVHGHWMIEVRSPNGKLISHTEFENSLFGGGGGEILPLLFTATQSAGFVYTPGEWGILLGDPSSSPCSAGLSYPFNDSGLAGPVAAFNTPFCVLAQQAPPAAIYPTNCGSAPSSGCSYNLLAGLNTQGNLALTGSVVSTSAGTVSQVQTLLTTCSGKIAPVTCPTETSPDTLSPVGGNFVMGFTAASLPKSSTSATPCGGTGQISCAVNVPEAGDAINVSVTISFQ